MNVKYTLTSEPEIEAVQDSFTEPEVVAHIIKDLNRGIDLAWCVACVTAEVEVDGERFTGKAYLGGCSYADWKQFEHSMLNEYDLRADALADLKESVSAAVKRGVAAKALEGVL